MSSVTINHVQIRRLLADLSKITAHPSKAQIRATIADCLGMSVSEYQSRLFADFLGMTVQETDFRLVTPSEKTFDGIMLDSITDAKLVRLLSGVIPSEMKDKQLIKLIAAAFGWGDDAFMHALEGVKTSDVKVMADKEVKFWTSRGYENMENWSKALRHETGLCLIGGTTASGKSMIGRLSALLATSSGRSFSYFYDQPFDDREERNNRARRWIAHASSFDLRNVICFDEVTTAEEMLSLVELSQTHLVIAVIYGKSVIDVIQRLERLVPSSRFDATMSMVRGIAAARLLMRLADPTATDIKMRYQGRLALCENAVFTGPEDIATANELARIANNSSVKSSSANNPADEATIASGLWTPFRELVHERIVKGEVDEDPLADR